MESRRAISKKFLPFIFETFKTKRFFFVGDTSKISSEVGKATPWFGMPGLGDKQVCKVNSQNVAIREMHKMGGVKYVKPVELIHQNLEILKDRDKYMFLIDRRITPFKDNNFYLEGRPIPIDAAYNVGGIHIVVTDTFSGDLSQPDPPR